MSGTDATVPVGLTTITVNKSGYYFVSAFSDLVVVHAPDTGSNAAIALQLTINGSPLATVPNYQATTVSNLSGSTSTTTEDATHLGFGGLIYLTAGQTVGLVYGIATTFATVAEFDAGLTLLG